MNADKITLAGYIAYLKGMYKRYGNISIAQLKHIESLPFSLSCVQRRYFNTASSMATAKD
jgi:hypothetical protein